MRVCVRAVVISFKLPMAFSISLIEHCALNNDNNNIEWDDERQKKVYYCAAIAPNRWYLMLLLLLVLLIYLFAIFCFLVLFHSFISLVHWTDSSLYLACLRHFLFFHYYLPFNRLHILELFGGKCIIQCLIHLFFLLTAKYSKSHS